MEPKGFHRKLTAILSADVAGYSRLMQDDEAATVKTLESYKQAFFDLIKQHRGRVVDSPGDNLLAEFASVVDAVQCAVAVQKEFHAHNAELAENRRMLFRIGVNLGDVIEEGDRIYGDGVNIAARLESLADPGGICISKTAFDHIESKLPLGYEFLGEQTVKNIAKPVGTYKVLMEPRVIRKKGTGLKQGSQRRMAVIGLAVSLVIIAGAVLWQFFIRSSVPALEKADPKQMALPLPELPSIAVLPFINLSDDPKQEFFCDGITEEIISALSKVRHLFVISRQSTFSYKGKPVKVKQVSEELGIRYVLEGSIQRSDDRIRINAQLIDALKGNHVWAERYDRDLKELFALQDEITMKILVAIQVKLTEGEGVARAEKYYKGKKGFDCYLKVLEGVKYIEGHNIESVRAARRAAEEAISICPDVPTGYVLLGHVHQFEYSLGSGKSPQESIEMGIEMAQKAIALDDFYAGAHGLLGHLYLYKREYDKAIAEGERAIALAPSGAALHVWCAMSLNAAGRSEEAIPMFQKAIRLNPFGSSGLYLNFGHGLRMTGKLEEAVSAYRKSIQRSPDNIFAHIGLAATFSIMGQEKEAHAEAAEILRINPNFSVDDFAKKSFYKDQSVIDNTTAALRKSGLK